MDQISAGLSIVKKGVVDLYNNNAPDAQTVVNLGLKVYTLTHITGVAGQDEGNSTSAPINQANNLGPLIGVLAVLFIPAAFCAGYAIYSRPTNTIGHEDEPLQKIKH